MQTYSVNKFNNGTLLAIFAIFKCFSHVDLGKLYICVRCGQMMWALESDGYRSKLKSQGNTDLVICELWLLLVPNFDSNLNMA